MLFSMVPLANASSRLHTPSTVSIAESCVEYRLRNKKNRDTLTAIPSQ